MDLDTSADLNHSSVVADLRLLVSRHILVLMTGSDNIDRFMGALTNNGRKLANFAGFYKGIQSAGAAVAFRIDALGVPFMNEFASNWGLLAGSLLLAAPVIWLKVRDTVPLEDDLKFSDETLEDVMPTIATEGHTIPTARPTVLAEGHEKL